LGIVNGSMPAKTGEINEPVAEHPVHKGKMIIDKSGKPSKTSYEVLEDYGRFSLVKFQLHSGRTHQIRIHMKFLGHPLLCDELYGDGQPIFVSSFKKKYKVGREQEERPILNRLALHSHQLMFTDQNGKNYDLIAEMPKDMKALLQQLNKR